MPPAPRSERDDALLGDLLHDVQQARERYRTGRSTPLRPAHHRDQQELCAGLADALEAYAAAAAAAGVPLPYRYRDELRLYRGLNRSGREGG